MARNNGLNYRFRNLLALVLTILFAIAEAEGNSSVNLTRCYNEHMVQITCPVDKTTLIAACVSGGICGFLALYALYAKIMGKIESRREARRARALDLEMLDRENGAARSDSDLSDVPPPQYAGNVADGPEKEPFGSRITPPNVYIRVPEPARSSYFSEPPMTANATTELLPVPATTPATKNSVAAKLKNMSRKVKETAM